MTDSAANYSSAGQTAVGAAQVVLAEKRTALAVMRTGIAVLALPLGVLSLLIAFSKHYTAADVLHMLVPVLLLCLCLILLGAFLVTHSCLRIRHFDHLLSELRRGHPGLGPYLG